MEQDEVEKQLLKLKATDPNAYATVIAEANKGLNPTGVKGLGAVLYDSEYSAVLGELRDKLKRDLNFENQADREAIGNAVIQRIRKFTPIWQKGGCPDAVARNRGKDCQRM